MRVSPPTRRVLGLRGDHGGEAAVQLRVDVLLPPQLSDEAPRLLLPLAEPPPVRRGGRGGAECGGKGRFGWVGTGHGRAVGRGAPLGELAFSWTLWFRVGSGAASENPASHGGTCIRYGLPIVNIMIAYMILASLDKPRAADTPPARAPLLPEPHQNQFKQQGVHSPLHGSIYCLIYI